MPVDRRVKGALAHDAEEIVLRSIFLTEEEMFKC
jgi:hypothetical protein